MRQYFHCLYHEFVNQRCPQAAASLAYSSLLALVPGVVLVYKTLIDEVRVLPNVAEGIDWWLGQHLSAGVGDQVRDFILHTATAGVAISTFGIAMLLISVLVMMYTIDTTINRIWHVHRPRHLWRRIIVYFLVLIFGPVAIAASLLLSTYLKTLPLITTLLQVHIPVDQVLDVLPLVIIPVSFVMLYKFVPDVPVRWRYALMAGLVAGMLFELAKVAFGLYVVYFTAYQKIYGALATIPLLLVWNYLTWVIVLSGVIMTKCLTQLAEIPGHHHRPLLRPGHKKIK